MRIFFSIELDEPIRGDMSILVYTRHCAAPNAAALVEHSKIHILYSFNASSQAALELLIVHTIQSHHYHSDYIHTMHAHTQKGSKGKRQIYIHTTYDV